MNGVSSKSSLALSQWPVLGFSLAGAATYGSYLLRSPQIRSAVFNPYGSFLYVVPIVVPFVAFLFDRAERWWQLNKLHYLVDLIVVRTAMGRVDIFHNFPIKAPAHKVFAAISTPEGLDSGGQRLATPPRPRIRNTNWV